MEHEGFILGTHDIPSEDQIRRMSYPELAAARGSEIGSPKYMTIEREIKKRLAKDQARINLPNMLYAALIGGLFALAGVWLGYYLGAG
jgi:hypothetical protein